MGLFVLKKKKKNVSVSHQHLIRDGVDRSSSTDDDDLSANTSTLEDRISAAAAILSNKTPQKKATSFRRLEEYEYDDDVVNCASGSSTESYIPPPDIFHGSNGEPFASVMEQPATKKSSSSRAIAKQGVKKHKKKQMNFERLESRSGDDDASSTPKITRKAPAPSSSKKKTTKATATTTPLKHQHRSSSSKAYPSSRSIMSSSSKKKIKNKLAPPFHLASDYQPTKTAALSSSNKKKKSRSKQLEMVGSTDSSSYGRQYTPPPFLPEHRQALSPKATFHLEMTKEESNSKKKTPKKKTPLLLKPNGNGYQKDLVVPETMSAFSGGGGGGAEDGEEEDGFDVRSWNSSPTKSTTQSGGAPPVLFRSMSKQPSPSNSDSSSVDDDLEQERGGADDDDGEQATQASNGDQTFHQIVFNESLDKIEQVAVAKSDTGASNFSDFVQAAVQLTQAMSKDLQERSSKNNNKNDKNKKNSTKTSTKPADVAEALQSPPTKTKSKWAALKDIKCKDTPSTLSRSPPPPVVAPMKHGGDDAFSPTGPPPPPVAAPSSLPSCRMKLYKGLSEPAAHKHHHEDDGFSLSPSCNSSQSSSKSLRQEFRAAIRAKPRTPLEQRTEPRCAERQAELSATKRDHSSLARVLVDDMSNSSVANATFSSAAGYVLREDPFQSVQSMNAGYQQKREYPFEAAEQSENVDPFLIDSVDPFHVGEETIKDNTLWDPNADLFQKQQQSQQSSKAQAVTTIKPATSSDKPTKQLEVNQTVSMDDGLIASIREATAKSKRRTDPDTDSRKRDPSPRSVQPSKSDDKIEYRWSDRRTSKKPPNTRATATTTSASGSKPAVALPATAILGSMLFRQTLATQCMEANNSSNPSKQQQSNLQKPSLKQQQQQQLHAALFDEDEDDSGSTEEDEHIVRIPDSVHAADRAHSVVSSVTEDASSLYDRSSNSGTNKWNHRHIQNMLNQFSGGGAKKKTLQSRDSNVQQQQLKPSLSRLEEEHANMFRSPS